MSIEQTPSTQEEFSWFPVTGLAILTVVLFVLFMLTVHWSKAKVEYQEPPSAVILLFNNLVGKYGQFGEQRSDLKLSLDYSSYDTQAEADEVLEEDLQNFLRVLNPKTGEKAAASYSISKSLDGYIEIVLQDKDGNALYPKVGMRYQMTDDDRYITKYTIGRLEPFSRYDEEYSELWK